MTYDKMLPSLDKIFLLAKSVESFPTAAGTILKIAKKRNFGKKVTDFLELFPGGEIFSDEQDFLTRSDEMSTILKEERDLQDEILRSP